MNIAIISITLNIVIIIFIIIISSSSVGITIIASTITGERPGNLVMVTSSKETLMSTRSQIEKMVATQCYSPPAHGARVVATVLQNPAFFQEWSVPLN